MRNRRIRSLEAEIIEALQHVMKHWKKHPDSNRTRKSRLEGRARKQRRAGGA